MMLEVADLVRAAGDTADLLGRVAGDPADLVRVGSDPAEHG